MTPQASSDLAASLLSVHHLGGADSILEGTGMAAFLCGMLQEDHAEGRRVDRNRHVSVLLRQKSESG